MHMPGHSLTKTQGTKLDNISLTSVPEPAVTTLLGFVGLVAGLRRRR